MWCNMNTAISVKVIGASQQIYDFQTLYLPQKFIIPKSLMVFAVLLITIFRINKLPSFCAVSNEKIMVNLNKWLVKQIQFLHLISLLNIKNKGIKEITTEDEQRLNFTQILLDCSTRNIWRTEWRMCFDIRVKKGKSHHSISKAPPFTQVKKISKKCY